MISKVELIILRFILEKYIGNHAWMFELNKLKDKLDTLIAE